MFSSANFKRRRSSRNSIASTVGYGTLEDRKLLATFSADSGAVTINFDGDRPASVEIGGETFDNPDETMMLILSDGAEEVFLNGGDGHIVDMTSETTLINNVVTIDYTAHPILQFVIHTGNGDDIISEDDSFFQEEISLRTAHIDAGGGNDQMFASEGFVSIDMGTGDDVIFGNPVGHALFDGGEGNDRLELSEGRTPNPYLFNISDGIINLDYIGTFGLERLGTAYTSFEILNVEGFSPRVLAEDGARTIINENVAWYYSEAGAEPLKFSNVARFGAAANSRAVFQVVASSYPLTFNDYFGDNFGTREDLNARGTVVVGGTLVNGDTTYIDDQIFLKNVNSLVVSNFVADEGQQVEVSANDSNGYDHKITGLTAETIFVQNVAHANLVGSDQGNDRFVVSESDSHLILYGNGGNDSFLIGYDVDGSGRDISKAGNFVNVYGGEGADFIRVNDQDSTGEKRFRVRESLIHSTGNSPDKSFQGLWHNGVEKAELIANSSSTQFLLSASYNTQYNVWFDVDQAPSSTFFLVGTRPATAEFLDLGNRRYAWWFGDSEDDAKFFYLGFWNHIE